MAQHRSFKEYVSSRFYNELYAAVSKHLEQKLLLRISLNAKNHSPNLTSSSGTPRLTL